MSGGRSRRSGADNERDVVRRLNAAGFEAERKGWQACDGYDPGDVILRVRSLAVITGIIEKTDVTYRIECKCRKAPAFGQLYRWLEGKPNDFLLVRQKGRRQQLVVMPLETLTQLLAGNLPEPRDECSGHVTGCMCGPCRARRIDRSECEAHARKGRAAAGRSPEDTRLEE